LILSTLHKKTLVMNLHSAIYISKVTPLFKTDMLPSIIEKSQINNGNLNITGYLYFESGHFLQYLESPNKTALDQLIRAIDNDSRHRIIKCIYSPNTHKRRFKSWNMALIQKKHLINLNIESEIITYMKWLNSTEKDNSYNLWELVNALSNHSEIMSLI